MISKGLKLSSSRCDGLCRRCRGPVGTDENARSDRTVQPLPDLMFGLV
jgi:hypothetical protein